jgi:hypothetical protein
MNRKLTSAAIAAAIIVSSSVAIAQQAESRDPGTSASETQHEKAQKKAKAEKKAKQATEPGAKAERKAEKKAEKARKKAKAPGGTIQESAKQTDEAARKTQEQIVGEEQQRENERRARSERERQKAEQEARKSKQEAKKTGEKVGKTTTTAAEAFIDTTRDVTRALDQPGQYNPFAVSLNPLGMVVGGRVSVNLEYAPVTHHVLIVSPHFVRTTATTDIAANRTADESFTGVGGEVGYRYYTGHKGMNGIFVGPSLIGGVYNAGLPGGNTAFTNVGIAADVGVQQIFWDHLALGAGVGLEYLHVSRDFHDLPTGPSTIASSGIKPRLLAQAGYAF